MGANTLGNEPNYHVLILSEGAGFTASVSVANEFWPDDTTCWIEFPDLPGVKWDALVDVTPSGSVASFNVAETATQAADIPDNTWYRMYLDYGGAGGLPPYLWYRGPVSRQE